MDLVSTCTQKSSENECQANKALIVGLDFFLVFSVHRVDLIKVHEMFVGSVMVCM